MASRRNDDRRVSRRPARDREWDRRLTLWLVVGMLVCLAVAGIAMAIYFAAQGA